jgi:hypothetical protein
VKKDIQVIRESIGKIVSMLTSRRIRCRQQGSKAYVSYRADGSIELVNIPYIPDDASEEFVAAVQGYLDHEIGHVLHSDVRVLFEAKKLGRRLKNMHNIIEDVYVEKKMTETFRGSTANLDSIRKFYIERIVAPKIEEALKTGNKTEATGYAIVVAFRAWGGQIAAQDFLKKPEVAELVQPLRDKLGEDLIERIGRCRNSRDCLDLAVDVKTALEARKEEPPAPPPATEPGDDDEDIDEETRCGVSRAGEEGEPEGTEPEFGGGDDEEVPEEPEEETGPTYDEPGEDVPPGDPIDPEEPGAAGEEPESGEPETADEPGEPEEDVDEGATDGDDAPGDDGAAGPETDDESSDESDDASTAGVAGDDDSAEGTPEAGDEGMEIPDASPEAEPDLGEAFEEERDFDKDMGEALSKEALEVLGDSDYCVFSTDWDKVEPAPLARGPKSAELMVERTQHMISSLQKHLERAIAAESRKGWNPGQRRGRLAPAALFKTAIGDDRVFRKRYETMAKNTAISLLIDCSASMYHGDRIGTAGVTAFALSSTLERLKVTYEVLGFTTRTCPEMTAAMRADLIGRSINYGRSESLYMPVFKPFSERLSSDNISRIAHITERPEWLRENVDGECLQIAAHRLRSQRAERHVLIVLSDGSPACPPGYGLSTHLKKVTKRLNAAGVETIGIGIQTATVKSYYDKHVVLNDLAELPTTVMKELTRALLS